MFFGSSCILAGRIVKLLGCAFFLLALSLSLHQSLDLLLLLTLFQLLLNGEDFFQLFLNGLLFLESCSLIKHNKVILQEVFLISIETHHRCLSCWWYSTLLDSSFIIPQAELPCLVCSHVVDGFVIFFRKAIPPLRFQYYRIEFFLGDGPVS